MNALIGSDNRSFVTGWAQVRSVTLTAAVGNNSILKVYDTYDETTDPKLTINAIAGETVNVHFNGIDFPAGVLVVPDSNAVNYVLEYVHQS